MNERSLRVLEFNKIKENLRKYAVTSGGKELVDNLAPYSSAYEVREALEESREALELLIKKGNPPFEGLHDVREGIERAKKGGCLNPAQLLYIGNMLRCTSRIQEYLTRKEEEESFPKLEDLAYILTPIKNLENEIEYAIVSEEEISDRASSTLHNIRRSLKEKNSSVRDKINSIVRSNAKYLQDAIYTMRGDRYVLPVKAEYKGAVPGLVHDQSSTGATLFIEPMSLVNLNNEIKELKLKEQAEIERILWALSKKVKDNSDVCSSNMKILLQIDFIFAKGKYASSIDGMMPKVNEDGSFNLVGAKHPLIDRDKVVPSDIYLGNNFSVLMVTGPNTGGKTVTIKTVGLLHLMGMSGLLIPTRDDSSISFYREVFADIGDEQSIEQSLSTFSSHLTNIVGIMREADRDSLVLFDELGAGTDPTEGAALATAIIETLKERGTKIIGTTHYSELKGYALKTPGVENASVEFDVETLRPTYRLLIGVPGKSNAFEISRRLGLDDFVIEKAKGFVSEENMQFEDLIRDLQEKSIIANRDAREAERIKIETEKIKRTYEEKLKRLETTRDKAYNEAKRMGKVLSSLGINMDFAPVADIFNNPLNTVIGDRSFGTKKEEVVPMVIAFAKGLKEEKVEPVIKHFPGHGNTSEDSHRGLAYANKSIKELEKEELVPFFEAVDKGIDIVMVGHIVVPEMDELPATLSAKWGEYIRQKFNKREVIFITDAMNMGAIVESGEGKKVILDSFLSGMDVILMPEQLDEAVEYFKEAHETGVLTDKRLNESVEKILLKKAEQNLLVLE